MPMGGINVARVEVGKNAVEKCLKINQFKLKKIRKLILKHFKTDNSLIKKIKVANSSRSRRIF